jgi:RNA polymerase sigma factor (sigma-70 family)
VDGKLRLVERILAGETRAFEELVRDHQRLVGHIVFRMISDPGDREDISQDVFMKVYRSLSRFRGDSKLSTWIATIAYHRCYDYLNSRKIQPVDDSFDDTIANIPDENSTPEQKIESNDISVLLKSEIEMLPPQARTIITLFHLDECSYEEIGKIMNLPEGTVKSHLFRSRRLLRKRLLSKYDKEELWQ